MFRNLLFEKLVLEEQREQTRLLRRLVHLVEYLVEPSVMVVTVKKREEMMPPTVNLQVVDDGKGVVVGISFDKPLLTGEDPTVAVKDPSQAGALTLSKDTSFTDPANQSVQWLGTTVAGQDAQGMVLTASLHENSGRDLSADSEPFDIIPDVNANEPGAMTIVVSGAV